MWGSVSSEAASLLPGNSVGPTRVCFGGVCPATLLYSLMAHWFPTGRCAAEPYSEIITPNQIYIDCTEEPLNI